ncbi:MULTISPECIES: MBL fold metallo-hydrolase [unclassified Clostridium]|uniref:MBL fold metallo-hydrolase n=1 Tax=unclassified Clostridium TaxID=2614128 RepID=UPI0011058A28|nr:MULTISPECIES: MBL fold metallo-hydrolase [unclassified Clostridium]
MLIERMATGPLGVNTYLLVESGACAVIDPGGEGQRIAARAALLGAQVEMILITHMHFDHIGGVDELAAATKAAVYAPLGELDAGPDPAKNLSASMGIAPVFMRTAPEGLKGGQTLYLAGQPVKVLSTPGHSPDGLSFYIDGAVFTGDALMAGSIGRTDFPGGDMEKLLSGIQKELLTLPEETKVYPGHMQESTIGREKRTNPFLQGEDLWDL